MIRKCEANEPFSPQVVSDHGIYHSNGKQTGLLLSMTRARHHTNASPTLRNVLYQQNGLQATAVTENPSFPHTEREKIKRALLILNITSLIFPPPNSSLSLQVHPRRQCEGQSGLAYNYNLVTMTLNLKSIILKYEELK